MLPSDEIVKITLIVTLLAGSGLLAVLKLMDMRGVIKLNVDAISLYLLVWTLIVGTLVSLLIIYSDSSTYSCDGYGNLVKTPCNLDEPNCFASKDTICPQDSGFLIRAKDTTKYLTIGEPNDIYLEPLSDDTSRQTWLLYNSDGSPFYFDLMVKNRKKVVIKSLWNTNLCLSTTSPSLVPCNTNDIFNEITHAPYNDGEGMCLKYIDDYVVRDSCLLSDEMQQYWEFIPV